MEIKPYLLNWIYNSAKKGAKPPNLEEKSVTITENGTTTIEPDAGYDGLSDVDVTVEGILDTSDATATAKDIIKGKIAYVNGQKITGTYEGTKAVLPDGIKFGTQLGTASDYSWLANVDTSNLTTLQRAFYYNTKVTTIGEFNSSNVTDMTQVCYGCNKLVSFPLINTRNVTNMTDAWNGCSQLSTFPILDTSSLEYMRSAFLSCGRLSEDSLNNILAMCINAVNYDPLGLDYKNLKDIGLTSAQATTCQTLSNWDAFVAAGWTTGY